MNEIIVGIDLGTTNSEVAVIKEGQPVVIADAAGNKILPSFVGVANDGAILVGEAARNQYTVFPERTIKSIKRKMGSDEVVNLAGAEYRPQEISAMILKRLKEVAEADLGQPIDKAVITVPAYFNDAQRQATREAGEIAGLEVVRMINEPTAAALSYETGHQEGKRILVYDLGGGTFDVSIVEIQQGVVEVVASHGNNHLGGDDFDQKIVEFLCDTLAGQHGIQVDELADAGQIKARLLRAATAAKIALSSRPFVMIEEEYLTSQDEVPVHLSVELSRSAYEEMIMPFIDETLDALHIALKDAGLKVSDIEEILLVGGSTRTPLVAQMLGAEVGLEPRSEVDPDLCVATGAAIQAGMLAGEEVSAVLVDITPYTFGTSVLGELDGMPYPFVYAPIIKRNTPIPVTKSEVFFTVSENQPQVDVEIYQGEERDAKKNILIGEFTIQGLSKAPAHSPIVMELSLDVNGVLQVTAIEKKSGLKKGITIENAMARMDQGEVDASRERVDALFGEQTAEPAGASKPEGEPKAVIEAKALIEKAEGLMEKATEEDREEIANLIEAIHDALESEDIEALTAPVDELSDILYYLEA
jgi:molecular chaperone DnaK